MKMRKSIPSQARKRSNRRLAWLEKLEERRLLVSDWHNSNNPEDVNNDLLVSPIDALLVINRLNERDKHSLSGSRSSLAPFVDTNDDGHVSPIDVLLIVNSLNNSSSVQERITPRIDGEFAASPIGFLSIPMTRLPGNAGQIVPLSTTLQIGREEFNEFGIFVADDAMGRVDGLAPNDPGYAEAVFGSSQRRVLYSRFSVLRTSNDSNLPAGSFAHVYVLQGTSDSSDPTQHLRSRHVSTNLLRVGWEEHASLLQPWGMVGDRGFDDATIDFQIGEPIDGNAEPVLRAIPNQVSDELTSLVINALAMDSDMPDDTIRYSLDIAPSGATIDASSGRLSWTPSETQGPGNFEVVVRATDRAGTFDTESFFVTVLEVNSPPSLQPIANQLLEPGQTYAFTATALDTDAPTNSLTYSLLPGAPSGASINATTGAFAWNVPINTPNGDYPMTVRVTDNGSPPRFDTKSFTISVQNCAFDASLSEWQVLQNGGNGDPGSVTSQACTAVLREGDSFYVGMQRSLTVPNAPSAIQVTFDAPNYDTSDASFVNDAFEIAFVDREGNSLVSNFAADRDSFFNSTEGLPNNVGTGVVVSNNVVTIGLNGLPIGTVGKLVFRLVNNDFDTQSSVTIRDVELVSSSLPAGMPLRENAIDLRAGFQTATATFNQQTTFTEPGPIAVQAGFVFQKLEVGIARPFSPIVEWSTSQYSAVPSSSNVIMAPAVIDLDLDGAPEIVFSTIAGTLSGSHGTSGVLRAVRGLDGSEYWNMSSSTHMVEGMAGIAVGNIDEDSYPEIIAVHSATDGLIAFEHDGSFKWLSPTVRGASLWGSPSIADLDQDGVPEIIMGDTVVSNVGLIRWQGVNVGGMGLGSNAGLGALSVVADLDLDGFAEVIAGKSAFHHDGSLYWNANIADGFPAIGNFDNDNFPEIVVVANGNLYFLEHNGVLTRGPIVLPGGGRGGAPTIADMDGDGSPEIGVAGAAFYTVFRSDGSVLWQVATQDASSNVTGSSVFDFDGDGRAEVVYGDEVALRIYDGRNGAELFSLPKSSGTAYELPVVADVDGDGHAEIVAVADNILSGTQNGLFVIGDDANWVGTREIWNQHSYHVTNINDDGSVPRYEANSWEVYNNYRRNLQPTGTQLGKPLITASAPDSKFAAGSQVVITGEARGQGSRTDGTANTIQFVQVNDEAIDLLDASGTFFQRVTILLGENRFTFTATDSVGQTVSATLVVEGTVPESAIDFSRFADITGSFSGQYFRTSFNEGNHLLNVDLATRNEGLFSSNIPLLVGVKNLSDPTVSVVGTDFVDAENVQYYDYSQQIPQGRLEPGQLTESPTIHFHNPNRVQFTYDLVFFGKLNEAPVITTLPDIEVLMDRTYRYDVDATDADDDSLTYSITTAPAGMTINNSTGLIEWAPAATQVGVHNVSVQVIDGRSGVSEQHYVISVIPSPPNRPPVITSTPVLTAQVSQSLEVGRIVVAQDINTLSPSLAGPNEETFAVNVAEWLIGTRTGQILLIESDPSDSRLYIAPRIKVALENFGFELTTSTRTDWTLEELNRFEAVFVGQTFLPNVSPIFVSNTVLIDYVEQGGGVYLHAGVVDFGESVGWGGFLGHFGLALASRSNSLIRPTPTNNEHAIFRGVTQLATGNGVHVIDVDPSDDFGRVVLGTSSAGFYAVYEEDISSTASYRYPILALDPDNDTLKYSLVSGPLGMQVLPSSGRIAWAPSADQVGNHTVKVRVEDGRGGFAEQEFIVCVHGDPTNHPPTIVSVPIAKTASDNYLYDVEAIDPDSDTLTFSLADGPTNMSIDPQSGLITWNGARDLLSVPVTVRVKDGRGGIDEQSFNLERTAGTAEIRGVKFNDANGNGTQDEVGNSTISNWTIYLDQNQNGRRDGGELSTQTDASGNYTFLGLDAGTYYVREENRPGWIQTYPNSTPAQANGFYVIDLESAEVASNIDFGNQQTSDPTNANPSIESAPPTTAIVSQLFSHRVDAIDPDHDTLTFQLVAGPSGMTIHPRLGVLVWHPTEDQVGRHTVVVRVLDDRGGFALKTFDLTASLPNANPSITSTPPNSANATLPWQYQVTVQDAESDPIQFSLESPISGMTIDSSTGLLRWTPQASQTGNHNVTVVVADGKGGIDRQHFTLNVSATASNQAPVFTSTPRMRAFAGYPYGYELAASDQNGDLITYSLTTGPTGMTLDAQGRLSWTPTFDQAGTSPHTVRIEASDGRAGQAIQTFSVTVGFELVNAPPAIVSNPPLIAVHGREYVYDAKASDPEADPLTWTLKSGPSGMSIDPIRGLLRWEPREDQLGEQTIIIEAQDVALQSAIQRFVIDVRCANTAPAIISVPPTQAIASRSYFYPVRADDLERDAVVFALSTKPAGMTIDPATGLIRWSPTTAQIGLHEVTILATDSAGAVGRQTFQIKVASPTDPANPNDPNSPPIGNRAPVIGSTPLFQAETETLYEYAVRATDPDGDAITYSVSPLPEGMTINATTGDLRWTPSASQAGQYPLTVTARDTHGSLSTQGFLLSVAVNQPPRIASTPITSISAGATYRYSVRASDPEGGPLTYRLLKNPAGMSIDGNGRILWQTKPSDRGEHDIQWEVQDNRRQTAQQSFKITVNQDTEAPRVELVIVLNGGVYDGGISIDLGNEFTVRVIATDNVEVRELGLIINGTRRPLDASGALSLVASTIGEIQLEAFALDSTGLKGEFRSLVRIVDPAQTNQPTEETPGLPPKPPADPTDNKSPRVVITSPEPASSVTNRTPIIGTVDDLEDNLWYYRVYYARADRVSISQIDLKDIDWVLLKESTQEVIDGELAVFDPTILSNDPYAIIVAAFDSNGRGFVQPTMLYVEGNVQVGNFRLEFTDLTVPLSGIPIQISRIYDTLNAADEGDFGYGWSLGVQSGRILEVAAVGAGGALNGGNDKLIPNKSKVYLTNPSGERVGFSYKEQLLSASFFGGIWRPYFQADPGVYDTLTIDETQVARGGLVGNLAQGINPSFYTLTTKDGHQYRYSDTTGLQSVREPNGNSLTFTRDGVKHSSGEEIKYIRDHRGRIVSIVDPDGNSLRYQYNAAGDLESFTNQVGLKTSYQYLTTPAHYLDQAFDSQGKRVLKAVYELNPETRQTEFKGVVDAAGNQVQRQDFDTKNNTGIVRDGNGNVTTLVYDDRGNVLEETDPVGNKTIRRYEDARNPDLETTIIDRQGIVTNRDYDARGNLLKITERGSTGQPLTPPLITEFTYDTGNHVTSIKNAVGNQTLFVYDAKGNLSKITNALGNTSSFTYDTSGRRETFTDFNGNKSRFIYEGGCPCGSPDKVINADGSYQKFFYNFFGQVLGEQHFEANGTLVEQKFTNYDNSGRITIEYDGETIGGKWNSVRKFYDAAGNLDWEIVVDPRSTTNTGIRDGLFNFLVADLNGTKEQLIVAGQSRITDYEYDANNRVVKQTDAEGGIVNFRYDMQGNRILLQDPVGNITTWVYDSLNRVTEERDPLYWVDYVAANASEFVGKTGEVFLDQIVVSNRKPSGASLAANQGAPHVRSFGYDAEGNQTEIIDRNNRRREFSYDHADRLLEERWYAANNGPLVETIAFTYDILGNMLTAQNANSKYTYTYDRLNRLKSVDNLDANPDTPHVILYYEYDAQGNVIKTSDDAGVTVQSTYSQRNQLETRQWFDAIVPSGGIKDVDDARVDFSYTASGRQKQIRRYADLTATTKVGHTDYTYDLVGRTDKLIHKNAVDALLSSYDYGYDFSGLLVDEQRDHQDNQYDDAIVYRYDLTGQLVDAAFNAQNDEQFVYDANGNRLSSVNGTERRTYTTGPANRLTSDSVYRYEYDGEGNLKFKIRISDGQVTEHFWDHHNRLVKVEERSAGGIVLKTVEFRYDAMGSRIVEVVNGVVTLLVAFDGEHSWADYNTASEAETRYLFSNNIDQIVAAHRSSESLVWYNSDKLGTVRDMSNAVGFVGPQIVYGVFGIIDTGLGANEWNRFAFTGREYQQAADLLSYRSRYLSSSQGQFISQDSFRFEAGDLNLYRYVSNSTQNFSDPTGGFAISEYSGATIPAIVALGSIAYAGAFAVVGLSAVPAILQTEAIRTQPHSNGVINALRHCTWMARSASIVGADLAIHFGELYEWANGNNNDFRIDLHNNRIGARLGERRGYNTDFLGLCFSQLPPSGGLNVNSKNYE